MKRFFKFASVAYPIIFFGAVLISNNMGLDIKNIGFGYLIAVVCAAYIGYEYSKDSL